MADLNVKHIPDDIYRAFKVYCHARDVTIRDELIRFMADSAKGDVLELVRNQKSKAEAGELFKG
jgi:hypothetical protein